LHDGKPVANTVKKSPNFTNEHEDYVILVAFVNLSVDAIREIDQEGMSFWAPSLLTKFLPRMSANSMEQRYKKFSSRMVMLNNKRYCKLKGQEKSGRTDDDYGAEV